MSCDNETEIYEAYVNMYNFTLYFSQERQTFYTLNNFMKHLGGGMIYQKNMTSYINSGYENFQFFHYLDDRCIYYDGVVPYVEVIDSYFTSPDWYDTITQTYPPLRSVAFTDKMANYTNIIYTNIVYDNMDLEYRCIYDMEIGPYANLYLLNNTFTNLILHDIGIYIRDSNYSNLQNMWFENITIDGYPLLKYQYDILVSNNITFKNISSSSTITDINPHTYRTSTTLSKFWILKTNLGNIFVDSTTVPYSSSFFKFSCKSV